MPRPVAFAMVSLLLLFSQFCFGRQLAKGSTARMWGLRGPVHSVLTESCVYGDNGEKRPGVSNRFIYDPTGYEKESYEYDSRGVLLWHTVYTRNGKHLLQKESRISYSKQTFVYLFNSDGIVTETDTYDSNGVLTSKTANDSSVKKEKPTVSTTRTTDGSISTIERFSDGSFKERKVKPDGTTVVHAHYRASPQPPLFLPAGDNSYGDWYQTSDANNQPLEFIEEPPTGEYRRMLTRYDKAGRQIETSTYDRSAKLLSETTFQYSQEDENGNWIERQVFEVRTDNKAAKLLQVTDRTIIYYGSGRDGER